GRLGVKVFDQFGGIFDVGKQHRHLLALAFEGTLGGENLLDQMTGGITDRRLGRCGRGRGWLLAEWGAALSTELGSWERVRPALGGGGAERGATLDAELGPLGSGRLAAWASHRWALRHGRARDRAWSDRSPHTRPASTGLGCLVSTLGVAPCQAKSRKRQQRRRRAAVRPRVWCPSWWWAATVLGLGSWRS